MFSSTLLLLNFLSFISIVTAGPTHGAADHQDAHAHRAFHHDTGNKVSRVVQPELRTPVRRTTCSYVPKSNGTSVSASVAGGASATAIASEPSSTAPGTNISKIDMLFPVSQDANASWSTYSQAVNPFPLSDTTFNETHDMSALVHNYTDAPDGTYSLGAYYPEGSVSLSSEPLGGLSFYAAGPGSVDLTQAKEATLGYSVYFPKGFEYNLGGKLPGFYGGDSEDEAYSCSGGRRDTGCFSARLMWRTDGMGEMYTYLPPYNISGFEANEAVCYVPPLSICNPVYGASVGRGSYNFTTGAWTTVAERVRLNDAGQANGELQLWANGESVINVTGLIIRDSDAGRIRGIQFQTFFGGNEASWASPIDQYTYFTDVSVAITEFL